MSVQAQRSFSGEPVGVLHPVANRCATAGDCFIRRAIASDAGPITELFQSIYKDSSHPFQTRDDVERFLADTRNFQILAEAEGRIVASMAMTRNDWNDSYELGRAITHPGFRRHGLAGLLMQEVVDWVCDEALGEIFYGFPRARRIVDLCAAIDPPMVVAGHDAGRNVANGARETHLIVFSVPPHSRFVHCEPAPYGIARTGFIQNRIYRPLGLTAFPGTYPTHYFVGAASGPVVERNGFLLGYDAASPSGAVEILAHGDSSRDPVLVCGDLERTLRSLPDIQHVTATVLADKLDLMRHLGTLGYRLAAYLPAWHKEKAARYDCVQMTRAAFASRPAAPGYENIVEELECGFATMLAHAAGFNGKDRH